MSQRLQKKQGNAEMRLQGRSLSARSPSMSITGPKQLRGTFLSRFDFRPFFAYSVLSSKGRSRRRSKRRAISLTSATRRSSQLPRFFGLVRARRCETDKEDGVDTKRKRRRKRRLQSGFNETSCGPSNRFRKFSPFATSPSLLSRVENWREKVEQRGLATSVCLCLSSSPLLSNRDAYLK